MKTAYYLLIVLVLLFEAHVTLAKTYPGLPNGDIEDQVLVFFDDEHITLPLGNDVVHTLAQLVFTHPGIESILKNPQYGVTHAVKTFPYHDPLNSYITAPLVPSGKIQQEALENIYTLFLTDPADRNTLITALLGINEIRAATANQNAELATLPPNDPYFDQSWHHEYEVRQNPAPPLENRYGIGTLDAWDVCTGSNQTTIGVIDGSLYMLQAGYPENHPDLDPARITTHQVQSPTYTYHGTMITGIIAASVGNGVGVSGINQFCSIFHRTWEEDQIGQDDLYLLILQMINEGVPIFSNSWGLHSYNLQEYPFLWVLGMTQAKKAGILPVCARHNWGETTPAWPACSGDFIFNVTAFSSDGSHTPNTDYDKGVDIGAPGDGIWSTYDGTNGTYYAADSGTSEAAPMVSAISSLLHDYLIYDLGVSETDLCPDDLQEIIKATTRPYPALYDNGQYGTGYLSGGEALKRVANTEVDFYSLSGPNVTVTYFNDYYTIFDMYNDPIPGQKRGKMARVTLDVTFADLGLSLEDAVNYLVWARAPGLDYGDTNGIELPKEWNEPYAFSVPYTGIVENTLTELGCTLETYIYYDVEYLIGTQWHPHLIYPDYYPDAPQNIEFGLGVAHTPEIDFSQNVVLPEGSYFFDETIQISNGITVEIEPGARIHFKSPSHGFNLHSGTRLSAISTDAKQTKFYFEDEDAGITVNGTAHLNLIGTEDSPVVLQAGIDQYADVPGQWEGLWFINSSYDNHIVEHVKITNASTGIYTVGCTGQIELSDLDISYCSNYGIRSYNSAWCRYDDVSISNCNNGVFCMHPDPATNHFALVNVTIDAIDMVGVEYNDMYAGFLFGTEISYCGNIGLKCYEVLNLDIGSGDGTEDSPTVVTNCGIDGTPYLTPGVMISGNTYVRRMKYFQIIQNANAGLLLGDDVTITDTPDRHYLVAIADNQLATSNYTYEVMTSVNTIYNTGNHSYNLFNELDTNPALPGLILHASDHDIRVYDTWWGDSVSSQLDVLNRCTVSGTGDIIVGSLAPAPYGGANWYQGVVDLVPTDYTLLDQAYALLDTSTTETPDISQAVDIFTSLIQSGFTPAVRGLVAAYLTRGDTPENIELQLQDACNGMGRQVQDEVEFMYGNVDVHSQQLEDAVEYYSTLAQTVDSDLDSLYAEIHAAEAMRLQILVDDLKGSDIQDIGLYNEQLAIQERLSELYYDMLVATAEQDYRPTLPEKYQLGTAYPNPFNPAVTIPFALPETADTKIVIYNTLGQRVAIVVDKTLKAGQHSVVWQATGASGQPVSSGVYFVQMQAADFARTQKIVLLK